MSEQFANVSVSPRYYRHSGKAPLMGILAAFGVGLMAAVMTGQIYGAIAHFAPGLGFAKIVATILFLAQIGTGIVTGVAVAAIARRFKLRNTWLVDLLAIFCGCIAVYAAWAGAVEAELVRDGHAGMAARALFSPGLVKSYFSWLYEHGSWSLDKDVWVGIPLAGCWVVEAGVILVSCVLFAHSSIEKHMFCETCKRWGTTRKIGQAAVGEGQNLKTLKGNVEQGKIEALFVSGRSGVGTMRWYDVSIEGCAECEGMQTLNVEQVELTRQKNGQMRRKTSRVVKRMYITADQTVSLATEMAGLSQPVVRTVAASAAGAKVPGPPAVK